MRVFNLFAVALLVSSVFLSGCNTTRGIGEDMERAGENVQHTVDKNR